MASITKKDRSLLATIVAAMAVEATPYHMVSVADAKKLIDGKFVETNGEITDGDKVAARATEAGIAENAKTPTPNTTPAVSSFAIGTATLDLGAFAKRARSASNYPFDDLQAGQFFFIPATEARPNPAKSIASTVSAATKKYADKPEAEQRVFVVAPFAAGEAKGGYTATEAGALIVRTK